MPVRRPYVPVFHDPEFTIRLKHGIHTIYLPVNINTTFAELGETLMPILRECYPNGLTSSLNPFEKTAIPAEGEVFKIAWGGMIDVTDVTEGWQSLKVRKGDTLGGKKLGKGSSVAFEFVRECIAESDLKFRVEIPPEEEYDD
ncbi:hypothetical protein QBC39DRAFT_291217 [Podospora conica]|nr:hypothetical protein QBC39DRAFT_291217 [Schizothecium conicum]